MRYLPFLISSVLFMALLVNVFFICFIESYRLALIDFFSFGKVATLSILQIIFAICLFIYNAAKPASYLIILLSFIVLYGAYKTNLSLTILLSTINIFLAFALLWSKNRMNKMFG